MGLRHSQANNRHWGEADKTRFYDVVAEHPPLCIFNSHDHSPVPEAYRWRPENRNGEMLLVYNTSAETQGPCYWLVRLEGNTVVPVRAEYASGREVDLTSIFNNEQADFLSASS